MVLTTKCNTVLHWYISMQSRPVPQLRVQNVIVRVWVPLCCLHLHPSFSSHTIYRLKHVDGPGYHWMRGHVTWGQFSLRNTYFWNALKLRSSGPNAKWPMPQRYTSLHELLTLNCANMTEVSKLCANGFRIMKNTHNVIYKGHNLSTQDIYDCHQCIGNIAMYNSL